MRWKKWILWGSASVIVLMIVGYVGMNLAVSYALRAVGTPSLSELLPKGKDSSGQAIVPNASNGNGVNTPGQVDSQQPAKSDPDPAMPKEPSISPNRSPQPSPRTSQTSEAGMAAPEPTAKTKAEVLTYQAEISSGKAKAVEDSISLREKAAVTSVLLKKLSGSDLQLFARMMSNGLSMDEKKEAKKIIMQKLTENEYNQLIGIAAKYGLSQGKSYSTTSK